MSIIDTVGVVVSDETQLRRYAERAAHFAMERVGRMLDWSDWIVDVHDCFGRRVLMLAFEDVNDRAIAA